MNFEYEDLNRIFEEMIRFNEIKPAEIPCVDLYMDQITTLFEDKLGHYRRNEDDKVLTKTMVNNYTKDKILMPAVNKKYSREHIILLILIYNLKQVISISDIGKILSPMKEETMKRDLDKMYSAFLEMKRENIEGFRKYFEDRFQLSKDAILKAGEIGAEENDEDINKKTIFLTALSLIDEANMQKRMVEKIIDEFFIAKDAKGGRNK